MSNGIRVGTEKLDDLVDFFTEKINGIKSTRSLNGEQAKNLCFYLQGFLESDSNGVCPVLASFLKDRKKCIEQLWALCDVQGQNFSIEKMRLGDKSLIAKIFGPSFSSYENIVKLFLLRCFTVIVVENVPNQSESEIQEQLVVLLKNYSDLFSEQLTITNGSMKGNSSGGVFSSASVCTEVGSEDKLRKALANICMAFDLSASRCFAFLCHTISILCEVDKEDGLWQIHDKNWEPGSTFVLIRSEHTSLAGIVFSLRAKLVGSKFPMLGRVGVAYPNPWSNSYMAFDPSFAKSIEIAWQSAGGVKSGQNVSYSLLPLIKFDDWKQFHSTQLTGRSAAGAFYVCFRSLLEHCLLRTDAVTSLKIVGRTIMEVDGLEGKLLSMNGDDGKRFGLEMVSMVVVADRQVCVLPSAKELKRVSSLDELYKFFVEVEQMLSFFSEHQSARWIRIGGKEPYSE
jgi:hypothetical protein